MASSKAAIESAMLRLLARRGAATACPSEVARAVFASAWRERMGEVRAVPARLAAQGRIEVFQRGRPLADVLQAVGPVRLRAAGLATVDFRAEPWRYRVGRGEEGVLTVEPYKSELLPLWRFRTVEVARRSAASLWARFVEYRSARDFVGMDMARKFIQMGWTRARRYANHASGRKYAAKRVALPREPDRSKAAAAAVFRRALDKVLADRTYRRLRESHERSCQAAQGSAPASSFRSGREADKQCRRRNSRAQGLSSRAAESGR